MARGGLRHLSIFRFDHRQRPQHDADQAVAVQALLQAHELLCVALALVAEGHKEREAHRVQQAARRALASATADGRVAESLQDRWLQQLEESFEKPFREEPRGTMVRLPPPGASSQAATRGDIGVAGRAGTCKRGRAREAGVCACLLSASCKPRTKATSPTAESTLEAESAPAK